MSNALLILLLLWNITVLFMFLADKLKAKRGAWRISEKLLIITSLLMGGVGGICGMVLFHHKVSKMSFRLLIPLAMIITLLGFTVICYLKFRA